MRWYSILIIILAVAGVVNAQYWFQFGVRAGASASFNNGAGVSIKTVIPQEISDGSLAFWIGETLSDGAFVQMGYVIENQSGNYPSSCDASGCSGYEYLSTNEAEWFYEYFPSSGNGSSFLGRLGPAGSAGSDGQINNYSFYSLGNTWHFLLNGNEVGNVSLGTGNSGPNVPVAFGELANTSVSNQNIYPVRMSNLTYYNGGSWYKAQSAYSYIGYGVGSEKLLENPYGVQEVGNRINYFEVGSGLYTPANGTQMWSLGYSLNIASQYSNLSGSYEYAAYTPVSISAPEYMYINGSARAHFLGWIGNGIGSYTGQSANATVEIDGNITETAKWELQYLINVSSQYGTATGSGWYPAGSIVNFSISKSIIPANISERFAFSGWSTGEKNTNGGLIVNSAENIEALWEKEFFLNLTSDYGNVIGSGWYPENSTANISVYPSYISTGKDQRLAFAYWSGGEEKNETSIAMSGPVSMHAYFKPQSYIKIIPEDEYGNRINVSNIYVDNETFGAGKFLFENTTYVVTGADFKGVKLHTEIQISASSPSSIGVRLPVYNVSILTRDLFYLPVNASLQLGFSNGTKEYVNTGNTGRVTLKDVPYGAVVGNYYYLGIKESFEVSGGEQVSLIIISVLDVIIIFCAVAGAAFAMHEIGKRHLHRGSSKVS